MTTLSTTIIKCDLQESIFTINLNKESVYNALNKTAKQEITSAIKYANENEDIKVIILTASGKAFCTGQDLNDRYVKGTQEQINLEKVLRTEWIPLIESIRESKKIIIGAINGIAAGAGLSLALACDLIIAHPKTYFISAFSKIGLCPDAGSTFMLTRALGRHKAMSFFLFNENLSAEDLCKAGLINEISESPEAMAQEWALQISLMAPLAIEKIKENVIAATDQSFENSLEKETNAQGFLGSSEDYQVGTKAFFEKSTPKFTGR